jgi:hypothetical protein
MMMMIKKYISAIFCFLLSFVVTAQDDDFGIWYSVNANLGVTSRLDAEISGVLRTFENAGKIEQGFLEAGLEYKFLDFLSVGGSYRLTEAFEDDSKYHFQHKLFLDMKGNLKAGSFTFQGRFRFQTRFRTYLEDVEDEIPDCTGRIRLKTLYRTQAFPVNPYIYIETFIPLNKEPERFIGKNRFAAGVEYNITKSHSIEAGYIFQRDYLPILADENILTIGYNLKF